jgi:hypothetical protein
LRIADILKVQGKSKTYFYNIASKEEGDEMKLLLQFIIISILSANLYSAEPGEVITYSGMENDLKSRWHWAESQTANLQSGYWIGYSIERLMKRNSHIGSFSLSGLRGPTLLEIIYGVGDITTHSWQSSDESSMVKKEIALLFRFEESNPVFKNLREVEITDMTLYVDTENKPIIWLGITEGQQSVEFLINQYKPDMSIDIREELVTIVAMHRGVAQVTKFLRDISSGSEPVDIREEAVFWLGQQHDPKIIPFLKNLAEEDPVEDVRENAVFALSEMDSEEAIDVIIELSKESVDEEVREKAIFWLGQKASKKIVATLADITYDAEDTDLKNKAVFALSQMDNNEGIPQLIEIARSHPNIEVRKKAIFWLGESEDPRALDLIIELMKNY